MANGTIRSEFKEHKLEAESTKIFGTQISKDEVSAFYKESVIPSKGGNVTVSP